MADFRRERAMPMTPRAARLSGLAVLLAAMGLTAGTTAACAAHPRKEATPTPPLPTPPPPQTDADARGLTEFANKVQAFVALHQRAEAGLPKLPARADPATVTAHQKRLAEAIRKSGPRPAQGHVFVPDIQPFFKRLLALELKGPGTAETREKVGEGNPEPAKGLPKDPDVKPKDVPLAPYATYPLDAPVSTVPPPILLRMPQLPKELEYRFVGKNLVLRDMVADLIVDYIPQAVP
jgi:hypothetical protein